MKVISEISLRDFKFWSGGEDRAKNCTDEQLDKIESIMESDAPESGWTDDDIRSEEPRWVNNGTDSVHQKDGYTLIYNSTIGGVYMLYREANDAEIEWYNNN